MSRKMAPETREWLTGLGFAIKNEAIWIEALTHGSTGLKRDYDRLEFLGDRVLGLTIAEWLYRNDKAQEGKLAQRLNALVSGKTCAVRAKEIDVGEHIYLGKQARDDGAAESDNVLGDIMEALLGANLLEAGFDASRDLVLKFWADALTGETGLSKHPKSALQEWAAGNNRKPPEYRVVNTGGPDHAREFTVEVSVNNVGKVEATANGKQDAQTKAARLFMERFG